MLNNAQTLKLYLFKLFHCYNCRKNGETWKLYKFYEKGVSLYKKDANIERVLHNI